MAKWLFMTELRAYQIELCLGQWFYKFWHNALLGMLIEAHGSLVNTRQEAEKEGKTQHNKYS